MNLNTGQIMIIVKLASGKSLPLKVAREFLQGIHAFKMVDLELVHILIYYSGILRVNLSLNDRLELTLNHQKTL